MFSLLFISMKTCIHCHQSKPLSDFHKQSCKPDGHRSVCKDCRVSDSVNYYTRNREIVKGKWKKYLQDNPEYNKNYYLANPQYFEKYRVEHAARYKQWRQDNKIHLSTYRQQLKNTDPNFKVACALRSSISNMIRRSGVQKKTRSVILLGCSINEFRQYLESKFISGMTWDNYGTWHIDHIIPCASFDLTIIDEQKKCFHYTNQQPLWAIDNLRKGDKIL